MNRTGTPGSMGLINQQQVGRRQPKTMRIKANLNRGKRNAVMQSLNVTQTTNDQGLRDNDFNRQVAFLNSSFDSKRQYEILMA